MAGLWWSRDYGRVVVEQKQVHVEVDVILLLCFSD